MLDSIYVDMDKGKLGGVVFMDLKKFFDAMASSILIPKLKSMAISLKSLNCPKSISQGGHKKQEPQGNNH